MKRVRIPLADHRLRYVVVLAVALVIVSASVSRPSPGGPATLFGLPRDKVLHAVAYAGFAAVLAYALLPRGAPLPAEKLALVVMGAIALGIGTEILQGTLPYRSMSPADVVADGVGALAGAVPWHFVRGRRWGVPPR